MNRRLPFPPSFAFHSRQSGGHGKGWYAVGVVPGNGWRAWLGSRAVVRLACMALAVGLAGVLLVKVARMPVKIKRINIVGLRHLTSAQVEHFVGVRPGALLTRSDVRRIERNLARHPAFRSVAVSRGVTGKLHVRVREREPVAWMQAYRCAVAGDGTLLPYIKVRDTAWMVLAGLPAQDGKVRASHAIHEALQAGSLARLAGLTVAVDGGEVWRRIPAGCWEWGTGEKKIRLTSPLQPEEFKRLQRFQQAYPDAWLRARMLDLRFADRVVVR